MLFPPPTSSRPCSSSSAMSGQPMGNLNVFKLFFAANRSVIFWITNKFNHPGDRQNQQVPFFFSQIPSFFLLEHIFCFFWILFIGKNDTDGNKPPCGKTQRQQTAKRVKFEDFEEATPQTPRMPGTRHQDFSDFSDFFKGILG